jgi:AcrR family transcriptional regulator
MSATEAETGTPQAAATTATPAATTATPAATTATPAATTATPATPAATATAARPLRRDAERNRLRILQAAAEVFTEQGLRATLDDVADRAGVGVGTVYRRFPDKEALVEALFTDRLDSLVGFAEQALADPDPWTGLAGFLERAATLIAGDRGLRQILMYVTYGRDRADQARTRMLPVVSAMVERAQAAGQVRADLRPADIPLTLFMLGAAAEYALQVRPEIWRRYLALIFDSLRPDRAGTTELPEPALSPDEMVQAMRTGTLSRD